MCKTADFLHQCGEFGGVGTTEYTLLAAGSIVYCYGRPA